MTLFFNRQIGTIFGKRVYRGPKSSSSQYLQRTRSESGEENCGEGCDFGWYSRLSILFLSWRFSVTKTSIFKTKTSVIAITSRKTAPRISPVFSSSNKKSLIFPIIQIGLMCYHLKTKRHSNPTGSNHTSWKQIPSRRIQTDTKNKPSFSSLFLLLVQELLQHRNILFFHLQQTFV